MKLISDKINKIKDEYSSVLEENNLSFNKRELYIIAPSDNSKLCRVGTSFWTKKNRLSKYKSESGLDLEIKFLMEGAKDDINKIETIAHKKLKLWKRAKVKYSRGHGSWYEIDQEECISKVKNIFKQKGYAYTLNHSRQYPDHFDDIIFDQNLGACFVTYIMEDPKSSSAGFDNFVHFTHCCAIILAKPKMPKYFKSEKNMYDIRNYSSKTLQYIKKNGFEIKIYDSIKSIKKDNPSLFKHHGEVNKKFVIHIENGKSFQTFNDAFFHIQKKLIDINY